MNFFYREQVLQEVNVFQYLVSKVLTDGSSEKEVVHSVSQECKVLRRINRVMQFMNVNRCLDY